MTPRRCALLALLALLGGSMPSSAKTKLAVLVLGAGVEPDLADNLTEVIIAKVAKLGSYEIAGKEEFRSKLGVQTDIKALGCIEDSACLGRAGATLGVTKVLAGTVGRRDKDYLFSLALYDLASGKAENRAFRLIPGGVPALLKVVDETAIKIFEHPPEPGSVRIEAPIRGARVYVDDAFVGTAPVRSPMLEAGKHHLRVEAEGYLDWARDVDVPRGNTLEIMLSKDALPKRRTWPKYVAWTTLGVAGVAAIAGGFLAVLSQESPTGVTRRDQLADLDHKSNQALVGNILFGAAGALAITSGALFYFYRADIFGGNATVAAAALPTGQVYASLRW